jgi:hypothetical protein
MMGSRKQSKKSTSASGIDCNPSLLWTARVSKHRQPGLAHPCPTCSLLTKRALTLLRSTKVATTAQPRARSARQSDLTCHHAKGLPLAQYI